MTYSINDSIYMCLRSNYKVHNICKERKCKPRILYLEKQCFKYKGSILNMQELRENCCIPESSTRGSASANSEMIGEIWGKGGREKV